MAAIFRALLPRPVSKCRQHVWSGVGLSEDALSSDGEGCFNIPSEVTY